MSEYLDQALAKKFHGYSDNELIRRIEHAQEFEYDDDSAHPVVQCEYCEKNFTTKRHLRRRGLGRFCSVLCKTRGTRKPRLLRNDAVQLSNGKWVLVSPEDLAWSRTLALSESGGYASKYHDKLHRMIYERASGHHIPKGYEVDHINNNKLDNRRANLRLAKRSENAANVQIRSSNTSGYKGVHRNKKRWSSRLVLEYQVINIGTFDSPEEAAAMYDQWVSTLVGEFAQTNFKYMEAI